jgi:hypothetical protein
VRKHRTWKSQIREIHECERGEITQRKVPKGYMALEPIFDSARTIKRHHHQGGPEDEALGESVDSRRMSPFLRLSSERGPAWVLPRCGPPGCVPPDRKMWHSRSSRLSCAGEVGRCKSECSRSQSQRREKLVRNGLETLCIQEKLPLRVSKTVTRP